MAKLTRDHFWLWGQDAGSHHEMANGDGKIRLQGENKMTAEEGGKFFGIHNMCRIGMFGKPEPPFDKEMDKLVDYPKVAWSIIGDNGSLRNDNGGDDVDPVLDLAKKYPNLVAGVMDDFFSEKRKSVYTPDVLKGFADRLHGANLDLWCVIYEFQIKEENIPWLHTCDVVTQWNWVGSNMVNLEADFEKLRGMLRPGQKLFHGCYLWSYGDSRAYTDEEMINQLNLYKKWVEEDKIDGIILCSNCVADIGLKSVDIFLDWMKENVED